MRHAHGFQRMNAAFAHGSVPAGPTPTPARRQAIPGQHRAVQGGGVRGAAGRLMPHAALSVGGVPGPWCAPPWPTPASGGSPSSRQ
jgi:hypothetical protein